MNRHVVYSDELAAMTYEVRVSPYIKPGHVFFWREGEGPRLDLLVRHMSEYALFMSGATWHVERTRCPTWDDTTECRCMLGGES